MSSWMPVQLMANGQCGCMSSMLRMRHAWLRGTSPVCWDGIDGMRVVIEFVLDLESIIENSED